MKTPQIRSFSDVPLARINLLDKRFWKHILGCQDGMCIQILLLVELPHLLRWAGWAWGLHLLFLAETPRVVMGVNVLLWTTAIWLYSRAWGMMVFCIGELASRGSIKREIDRMIRDFIRSMGGSAKGMIIEMPMMGMRPPGEAEDPVERILRESAELLRKKNDGDPSVS